MAVNSWAGNSCDSLNKSLSRAREDSEKGGKSDWRCWQTYDMNQQGEKFFVCNSRVIFIDDDWRMNMSDLLMMIEDVNIFLLHQELKKLLYLSLHYKDHSDHSLNSLNAPCQNFLKLSLKYSLSILRSRLIWKTGPKHFVLFLLD